VSNATNDQRAVRAAEPEGVLERNLDGH
jgi:hypothetical protein